MIIAANWKAYVEDIARARALVSAGKKAARRGAHTIIIAPPAPFLGALAEKNTSALVFAAEDVSVTTGGAHTGEITARMSASVGATHTIVGHSERRAAGDTNEIVAEKLGHAFASDLTPILCVGERERDADGRYLGILREEILSAFQPFTVKERNRIILAYEPIWAIGKSAQDAITTDELTEMMLYIRKVLGEILPGKNASRAKILYGGSVESSNIRLLAEGTGVDGFLIGHAATDPDTFTELVKALD